MSTIQTVTETLIRLAKQVIHPDTVLVFPDDVFKVPRTPSLILQGPTLVEDGDRRTQAHLVEKDIPNLTYERWRHPRLYHLDFDVIVTAAREAELLKLQEKVARFYQVHPVLEGKTAGP